MKNVTMATNYKDKDMEEMNVLIGPVTARPVAAANGGGGGGAELVEGTCDVTTLSPPVCTFVFFCLGQLEEVTLMGSARPLSPQTCGGGDEVSLPVPVSVKIHCGILVREGNQYPSLPRSLAPALSRSAALYSIQSAC